MAPEEDIYWKEEIDAFSLVWKQIKVSQTTGKVVLIWFLLGHNIQRLSACRLPFPVSLPIVKKYTFNLLLIAGEHCYFIILTKYEGFDVIYYGYLFHIVFH